MNRALREIDTRRTRLIEQSRDQRADMARYVRGLQPIWHWSERARRGARFVRTRPLLLLPLGLLLLRRPRRLLRAFGGSWFLLRLARSLFRR